MAGRDVEVGKFDLGSLHLLLRRALIKGIGLVQVWRETGNWGDYCRPISDAGFRCF